MVFNFHLVGVIHLLWQLDFYERTPLTPKPAPTLSLEPGLGPPKGLLALAPFLDNGLSDIDRGHAKDIIEQAKGIANELELRTTKHRVETFERNLRFNMKGEEYLNEIKVLREALQYDFRDTYFYHYPRAKTEVLLKASSEWKTIFEAFPDLKRDAGAAYDCYALNHNTASVFHSMRVAEYGLRALAAERRVRLSRNKPIDWGTWQEVIRELQRESERIGQKGSPGAPKDKALAFYNGALADLNAFKDEYRNQVMHVRKDYDEHQALRALTKIHAFMERISEKLNYKNKRVRWGVKFRGS